MGRTAVSIAALTLPLLLVACGGGGGGSAGDELIPLIGADQSGGDAGPNGGADNGSDDGSGDGFSDDPGIGTSGGVTGEMADGVGSATNGDDPVGAPETDDTDGDGQPDAVERSCGSDPLDPQSDAADGNGDDDPDCLGGFPSLAVTGLPGEAVNCADTLPCTWRSPQGDVTFTLTYADSRDSSIDQNEADFRYDDLGILYEVVVANDTTLTFLGDASFSDADFGTGNLSTQQFLNLSTAREFGASVLTLLGGTTSRVLLVFNGGVKGTGSVDTVTIPILRDERRVEAVFGNVPHGRVRSPDRDCQNVLPCTWTSPDGATRVTVDNVGITALEALRVDLSIVTTDAETTLSLGTLSRAIGTDLASFTGDAQRFGNASDYTSRTVSVVMTVGETVPASIRFVQTPSSGLQALTRLSVDLFESVPLSPNFAIGSVEWSSNRLAHVPRLNPVFRSLPLAR